MFTIGDRDRKNSYLVGYPADTGETQSVTSSFLFLPVLRVAG